MQQVPHQSQQLECVLTSQHVQRSRKQRQMQHQLQQHQPMQLAPAPMQQQLLALKDLRQQQQQLPHHSSHHPSYASRSSTCSRLFLAATPGHFRASQ
jgi:hypothetical protein